MLMRFERGEDNRSPWASAVGWMAIFVFLEAFAVRPGSQNDRESGHPGPRRSSSTSLAFLWTIKGKRATTLAASGVLSQVLSAISLKSYTFGLGAIYFILEEGQKPAQISHVSKPVKILFILYWRLKLGDFAPLGISYRKSIVWYA
jgi:hypothetical protein